MTSQKGYVPPQYIPVSQSDEEPEPVSSQQSEEGLSVDPHDDSDRGSNQVKTTAMAQWSSGICACCDDMQSCVMALFCPCFLFGKNSEFLGSGTFIGSCTTHFVLWAVANTLCCMLTAGLSLCLPVCFVASYACGYRRTLRSKYNLPEAPCGDFVTHLFCHLCAICQEYREIRERSGDEAPDMKLAAVTAPPVQMMEP